MVEETNVSREERRAEHEMKMMEHFFEMMQRNVERAITAGESCPFCKTLNAHAEDCKYIKMKEIVLK